MPYDVKIATCSYCGRRQTLRMTARDGHELACGACGAPLHEMKWLKPRTPNAPVKRSPPRPAPHGYGLPDRELGSRRKKKKRSKFWKKALEEVFDVIEDILD